MGKRSFQALSALFFRRLLDRRTLIGFSVLHALLLMLFSLVLLQLPFTTDEEMIMLRFTYGLKHHWLWRNAGQPDPERFLFVCLSWDKLLVPKKDAEGFEIGKEPITDRRKLVKLLDILNEKPLNHKFLLLDVRFEEKFKADSLLSDSSSVALLDSLEKYDQALGEAFRHTRNYLVSYHKNEQDKLVVPAFEARRGLSDYETTDEGTIVKFSLIQADTAHTSPLLMYEQLYGKSYQKGFLINFLQGRPMLNSFILDYRLFLNKDSLTAPRSNYHKVYLGELLALPPELIHELTKGRIVITGDFEDRDIHQTIFGPLPGSLILLNAFLALENEDNQITLGFFLFLLTGYTLVSYRCFSRKSLIEHFWLKGLPLDKNMKKFIEDFTGYALLLGAMSVLSYFLFNRHLTILLLVFWFQFIESALNFAQKRHARKRAKFIVEE